MEELGSRARVHETLDALVEHGVMSRYDEGTEPVYAIGPENEHVAAFYRNGIVHWFVTRSIVELALLRAVDEGGDDPTHVAWHEALRLRDLFKFDFFFSDKETFRLETLEGSPSSTRSGRVRIGCRSTTSAAR